METPNNMLGGRCLNLQWPFTRDDLLAQGLKPASADEIMRFAERLAAKRAPSRAEDATP